MDRWIDMFFFSPVSIYQSRLSIIIVFFPSIIVFSINGYNSPIQWFIVDLPIKNCDFSSSYVNVYQRVGQ